MTSGRWLRINELYHDALELGPQRQAVFLHEACAGDTELRREVESLIASHYEAEDFITEPALNIAARVVAENRVTSLLGKRFSHYRIESLLGVGGMGEVFLAEDTMLNRRVALKLFPALFTNDAQRLRRFEQESQAASALNHPNILTIYEIGRENDHYYMATEFIEGETLCERMVRQRMKLDEALDVAAQVASALTAAHVAGIVHRDIKPENIMLRSDGFVKVLDFGLAKLINPQPSSEAADAPAKSALRTNPGTVMGTIQYMSPEQARGHEVDARTDIWSLGVMLYEMVAARVPFSGETPSHVVVAILESQFPELTYETGVPEKLEEIITKALRKSREERYQSASELAFDLKDLKQDLELERRVKRTLGLTTGAHSAPNDQQEVAHPGQAQSIDAAAVGSSSHVDATWNLKHHKRIALGIVALFLAFAAITVFVVSRRDIHVSTTAETVNSLAVMPFINDSGDPNAEYISDGVTDSVINSLTRLHTLKVISLNAVMRYKNKQLDPQKVGGDLNVEAILIGRMTERGDDLTISTELVNVRDNTRIWGEQYKTKLSNIVVMQEEISRAISEKLQPRLTDEDKQRLAKHNTESTEAFLLYSLGRRSINENRREGFEKAIQYYEEAIAADPAYARAYVGLASAYRELETRGFWIPKDVFRKREWAALKALELDDTLSEAHVAVAEVKLPGDRATAEKELKRALELDPRSIEANQLYALNLAYSGRTDEAIVYAQRADGLDSSKSIRRGILGYIYFLARQYDAAIGEYLKTLDTSPNFAHTHFFLGEVYVTKGLYKEGIAELQKAVTLDPAVERWDRFPMLAYAYAVSGKRDDALKILVQQKSYAKQRYISSYNLAIIYAGLGDKDRAFESLNKAYEEGNPLGQVSTRPLFDLLRSDPRYATLLRRINNKA